MGKGEDLSHQHLAVSICLFALVKFSLENLFKSIKNNETEWLLLRV